MTGMLASVNCAEEALLAIEAGADIIDLKQPSEGALGALEVARVKEIVALIGTRAPVSATIGDLAVTPEPVFRKVEDMAATGVEYVKIGFFPGGDWPGTVLRLSRLTRRGTKLIAVLFADARPDLDILPLLADCGFAGAMLDTMDKSRGSLTGVMPPNRIGEFVHAAKSIGLMSGLAGSLGEADIIPLLALDPDYLGFRGALCGRRLRTSPLEREAIFKISQMLHPDLNASSSSLSAGPCIHNVES
ncbi:MAG: (5-formylfuran-3-yl)methyl phosphate synthase [Gammaproteobacteria bacterium]